MRGSWVQAPHRAKIFCFFSMVDYLFLFPFLSIKSIHFDIFYILRPFPDPFDVRKRRNHTKSTRVLTYLSPSHVIPPPAACPPTGSFYFLPYLLAIVINMKILVFLLPLFSLGACISVWEAKLVQQKATAAAEAPHPIIRSAAEASA